MSSDSPPLAVEMDAASPSSPPPGIETAAYHSNDRLNWPSPPPSTASPTAAPTATDEPTADAAPNPVPPVRRKPLPQNASSMIPPNRPGSPSSFSSQGEAPHAHSGRGKEIFSPIALPPSPTYDDTLPFVPRDLDRYDLGLSFIPCQ